MRDLNPTRATPLHRRLAFDEPLAAQCEAQAAAVEAAHAPFGLPAPLGVAC